jgi:hypothetical protein
MEQLRRFLPLAAFLWILLGSPTAFAQTLTLNAQTSFEIQREEERFTNEFPLMLSRKDCFDASPTRYTRNFSASASGSGTTIPHKFWLTIRPSIGSRSSAKTT